MSPCPGLPRAVAQWMNNGALGFAGTTEAGAGPLCSLQQFHLQTDVPGVQSIGRQRWSLHTELSLYLLSVYGVNRS